MKESKTWPFVEAERILKKIDGKTPKKGYVLFETGYGPSGLPHIGTFCEVARTSMVRNAFSQISDIPTKMFCISDDMDGMRKIPQNIPNRERYNQYLGLPLSEVPDPFDKAESYGAGMNGRMKAFLDKFGFEANFVSSYQNYKSGKFNEGLLKVLENYEEVMSIMLPTLGEERQKTYSPFLPVCPNTGRILQASVKSIDKDKKTIVYQDPFTEEIHETSILDGNCKLQWKVDFAMKWTVFAVDFEMYGKDHMHNAEIYDRICKAIGGEPPSQMYYEMFLGEDGDRVSKSKGNGAININEWLSYAPHHVLSYFIYLSPQRAKRLHKDVIAKAGDEYVRYLVDYDASSNEKYDNPLYHAHYGDVPILNEEEKDVMRSINYSMILNIIVACNAEENSVVMRYLSKNCKLSTNLEKIILPFVEGAMNYYNDFIRPERKFRKADEEEKSLLESLVNKLREVEDVKPDQSDLQSLVFSIAKEKGIQPKAWFSSLYNILFGSNQGPRLGSFISLYGIPETIDLINKSISRD